MLTIGNSLRIGGTKKGGAASTPAGWTFQPSGSGSVVHSNGVITLTGDGTTTSKAFWELATEKGRAYTVSVDVSGSATSIYVGDTIGSVNLYAAEALAVGTSRSITFVASGAVSYVTLNKTATQATAISNWTYDELASQASYGFQTNYPLWNSNPLGYIFPTSSGAISNPLFSARAYVTNTGTWPNGERVVGRTPTGAPTSGGVWWFHQTSKVENTGAINTVGEYSCTFAAVRGSQDAGNWNRLIEVFLEKGGSRVGEIGFITFSPTVSKTWNATGTLIGNMIDRYGREWSCRRHSHATETFYYVFMPTGSDFISGAVDMADAFRFLIRQGEYTGEETIATGTEVHTGGRLFYDLEAVQGGGVVDVTTTSISFQYQYQAPTVAHYIWDGEEDGNARYFRPFGPTDGVTWDAANRQIVMTRNVAAGVNSRVVFGPFNPPVAGKEYKIKVLLAVSGGSPAGGTTAGYSTSSNGASATALPSIVAGENVFVIPADAATGPIYLSFHQPGSTGSDNVLRIGRVWKPVLAVPGRVLIANMAALANISSPPSGLADQSVSDHPDGASTALQQTTSGNTTVTVIPAASLGTAVDVRDGYLQIPFKVMEYGNRIGVWTIELHSAGTPTSPSANYHQIEPFGEGPSGLRAIATFKDDVTTPGRWQTFSAHANDFAVVGTGADLSAIKFARLRIRGTSGYTCVIQFGSIWFQKVALPKAKAIIYFDDGYTSAYTDALPLLQAKGWKGVFNLGAMAQTLDAGGRMSTAQVKALVAEGWQFQAQAFTDETLATVTAMDAAGRDLEMKKQREWAILKDIPDPLHGSYYSQVTQYELAVLDMFKSNFRSVRSYRSARGANPPMLFGESYPAADPFLFRSLAGDHESSRLIAHCEQAVANKGIAAFTFHSSLTYLPDLLEWLDDHRADIDVVTEQELHDLFNFRQPDFDPMASAPVADVIDMEDAAFLTLDTGKIASITGKKSGLTLTQANSGKRATYDPSYANGRAYGVGDGVNTSMAVIATTPYPTGSSPSEVWALVSVPGNPTELKVAFSYGSDSGNESRRVGVGTVTGGGRAVMITGTGSSNIQAPGPSSTSLGGVHLIRGIVSPTETYCVDNRVAGSPLSGVPATANNRMRLFTGNGATNMWLGGINSVIVVNSAHANWNIVEAAKLAMWFKGRGAPLP